MQSNQSPLPDPLAGYEWDDLLVERKHEHAIHRLLGLYIQMTWHENIVYTLNDHT